MPELIKVGLADYKSGSAPDSLITYGLGSCIGIALYDTRTKIGGLAHIMLPDSAQSKPTENPAKFADKCLPLLLNELLGKGAHKASLQAKIAGGAQMFALNKATDIMKIGERNEESVRAVLKKLGIPVVASDTGENYGRTVELLLETGKFRIRTISKGEKEI
ncbi:MAG: chemotaxis protein CheD [Acidaminococcales bacterium]|jgi:chemotaxis protein CheD|nr:chemotaxis protein CheD [Acidaminococcales bacterium]